MIDWKEVRNNFPACENYTYLNPAEGSPVSQSAANEGKRFYDEMLVHGDLYWEHWLKRMEGVRSTLAQYIGASKEEIAFTTNTSHGMNLIAQFLKRKGAMLTMRDEFPSSTIPWFNQGVSISFVEPVEFGYPMHEIEKAITPQTKVLVTSYVQYKTGFRQDLLALGALCKKHDLIFVVNATQGIGVFPIDVRTCNIDFLMFTGLKWAAAGYGIGALFMAKKWLRGAKFPFVGWRSLINPDNMENTDCAIRSDASVVEAGCPHFPSIFALGGSLDFFNSIGKENIEKRVLYLNKLLQSKLEQIGIAVIHQKEDKHRSGILIAKIENAPALAEALFKKGIVVSARGEGLRVSTTIFNNEEDLDTLVRALTELLNLQ